MLHFGTKEISHPSFYFHITNKAYQFKNIPLKLTDPYNKNIHKCTNLALSKYLTCFNDINTDNLFSI